MPCGFAHSTTYHYSIIKWNVPSVLCVYQEKWCGSSECSYVYELIPFRMNNFVLPSNKCKLID